ncbi:MAG: 5-formyltetrahydrofolate cyclo-ligase [Cyclobacteriaceae bacterium]
MSDAKAKIRKGTLYNRRLLSETIWKERNKLLEDLTFDFLMDRKVKSCHIFLPIRRNHEFDSWGLIKRLTEENAEVMLSVSNFSDHTMSHFVYTSDVRFEENKFNIPEPVDAAPADISRLDAILIPLLAADKKGNRVGYGKGFYDRLLSEMPKSLLKVGVNLAPLFDHFGFAEAHDERLDYCITPHKIFDFHE